MLYELRVYECIPGRIGALNNRFRNHTTKICERLGINSVGYWEDVIGISNRLTYILVWENMADRESRWNTFLADPEWQTARARSEEDEPIVARVIATFMKPTD